MVNKQSIQAFATGLLAASLALFIFKQTSNDPGISKKAMIEHLEDNSYVVLPAEDYKKQREETAQLQPERAEQQKEAATTALPEDTNKQQGEQADSKKTANPKKHDEKNYTLIISSGMPSSEIGRQLEEAGMINSSKQFNEYLTENGYAEKLQVGSHVIHSSMTLKEMAVILTTR
jgi:hypothetical protein